MHNCMLFFTGKCGVPMGIHESFSLQFEQSTILQVSQKKKQLLPWLLEGPEHMWPEVIFQSDIQFLGIQRKFLAISFIGPQATMIRIK